MTSLLTLLVRLFPPPFREEFGSELTAQIRADYERARRRGRLSALWTFVGTALDLVRSALAERVKPAWVHPDTPSSAPEGMGGMMINWLRDLRLAVRALRRAPGFTAVTVLTLGLAIGANAGIFSVVDTVLLHSLPFAEPDRLVYIAASAPGSDFPEEFRVSAEFLVEYQDRSELLESVSSYNFFTNTLRTEDRTERVWMSAPDMTLFRTLGATPILGRLPVPEDEGGVAVISYTLWTTWFGSDSSVIGRSVQAGGTRTIIGVMGPDFWFPNDRVLLWLPNVMRPERITPGRFGMSLVARAAPDVSSEALIEELGRLNQRLPDRFGGSAAYARMIDQIRPVVRPMSEELLGDVSGPLWVLLGSVGIVLLIACANVANLFMVRAERRQRELAVRRAIGAARGQLIRAQLSEALVVAGLAGIVAIVLASVTVPLFIRAAPPTIPRLDQVGITGPTLLFALTVTSVSALLCGLLPAVRSSVPDLGLLRDANRGSTRRRHWTRDALVVGQTALALVLLIGSGLLVRSYLALRDVDPGYDTDDIFTFQIAPSREDLNDGPTYARFHLEFMERVAALPGVASVGVVDNVPLNEGVATARLQTEETSADPESGPLIGYTWTGGDYFGTMGISLLRGRVFRRADHISDPNHVVISRSAAGLLWPGVDNPVGRRLRHPGLEPWQTVVGVVEDVMQYSFRDTPQPIVYFPLAGPSPDSWAVSSPAYVVKTSRADVIAPEVRALVREVVPSAPMYRVFTMEGLAADSMVRLSFTMLTLGVASILAMLLGTIGIYGVVSYVVAGRTQEIGVRMALGAEAARVKRMVVAQGARVVALGVMIGIGVALGATRVLGTLLFGVEGVDVGTFASMSVGMIAVGMLASYLPARRASDVDPIVALRGD